jgi:hypothetical protein
MPANHSARMGQRPGLFTGDLGSHAACVLERRAVGQPQQLRRVFLARSIHIRCDLGAVGHIDGEVCDPVTYSEEHRNCVLGGVLHDGVVLPGEPGLIARRRQRVETPERKDFRLGFCEAIGYPLVVPSLYVCSVEGIASEYVSVCQAGMPSC